MTGRDLILYILSNNLEDEPIFNDGKLLGFMTICEAAEKMDVGTATVLTWIKQGRLPHLFIGGFIYIPADFKLEEINE